MNPEQERQSEKLKKDVEIVDLIFEIFFGTFITASVYGVCSLFVPVTTKGFLIALSVQFLVLAIQHTALALRKP